MFCIHQIDVYKYKDIECVCCLISITSVFNFRGHGNLPNHQELYIIQKRNQNTKYIYIHTYLLIITHRIQIELLALH
jgi:hypothetical protein